MSMWRAAQRDKVSSIFLSFKRAAGKEKYHKSKKKKKQRKEINARWIQALCSSLSHRTMILKENINASNGREDIWHFIEDHKPLSNAGC